MIAAHAASPHQCSYTAQMAYFVSRWLFLDETELQKRRAVVDTFSQCPTKLLWMFDRPPTVSGLVPSVRPTAYRLTLVRLLNVSFFYSTKLFVSWHHLHQACPRTSFPAQDTRTDNVPTHGNYDTVLWLSPRVSFRLRHAFLLETRSLARDSDIMVSCFCIRR